MNKTSGASMMGYGALATIVGLIMTSISHSLAPAGGHYIIFTGLIFGGIVYFVIGFFKMLVGK